MQCQCYKVYEEEAVAKRCSVKKVFLDISQNLELGLQLY